MQIVRDLAGYSLGRSDLMRRAMAKKKKDVMAQEREYFINGMVDESGNVVVEGCVRRGVPKQVAEKIYDDMSSFASYAFNKSHAAAYGMVAVQTGWLKVHHPVPFMAAIMNSVMDNAPKVAGYIQYCRAHDIPLLPPDVNKSVWRFSVDNDDGGKPGIRFGLGGVKNVGHGAVQLIEKERQKGAYQSIFDFVERTCGDALNKRTVESLIKAGAFDSLGHNRAQLLSVYEVLMDDTTQRRRQNVSGQMSLFDLGMGEVQTSTASGFVMPDMPEHPRKALLGMEKEMTGVYITGHPLDEVAALLGSGFTTVAEVLTMGENNDLSADGMPVSMAGILTLSKGKITKKGAMMGFVSLEDLTGVIEGLVFPKVYEKYIHMLSVDSLVVLDGKLSFREDEEPKLLVDGVRPLNQQSTAKPAPAYRQTPYRGGGKPQPVPQSRPAGAPLRDTSGLADSGAPAAMTDAQLAKHAAQKLYLLANSRDEMDWVKAVCQEYPGDMPVYVKLRDEGIALLLEQSYWCEADEMLLNRFRQRFGDAGVVLKG